MTSTVGSLLGVPTTTRLTNRHDQCCQLVSSEQQPTTPTVEARLGLRLSQAQQYRRRTSSRRRNSLETPRRKRQQQLLEQQPERREVQQCDTVVLARRQSTITLPWSFFVLLLCTMLLCLHYSYFGSTISPLATARQGVADIGAMAENLPSVITMEANGDMTLPGITLSRTCQVKMSTGGSTIPETISEE
eukprot:2163660-Amphidinium_carterae.1